MLSMEKESPKTPFGNASQPTTVQFKGRPGALELLIDPDASIFEILSELKPLLLDNIDFLEGRPIDLHFQSRSLDPLQVQEIHKICLRHGVQVRQVVAFPEAVEEYMEDKLGLTLKLKFNRPNPSSHRLPKLAAPRPHVPEVAEPVQQAEPLPVAQQPTEVPFHSAPQHAQDFVTQPEPSQPHPEPQATLPLEAEPTPQPVQYDSQDPFASVPSVVPENELPERKVPKKLLRPTGDFDVAHKTKSDPPLALDLPPLDMPSATQTASHRTFDPSTNEAPEPDYRKLGQQTPPPPAPVAPQPPPFHAIGQETSLSNKPQLHKIMKTCRAGTFRELDGDVVVFGDINSGAEIRATGDIIVFGALRGVAHAGSQGNRDALITASVLDPTQIRIADQIAIAPKKKGRSRKKETEVAFINSDNQIEVKSYHGKMPKEIQDRMNSF